MTPTNKLKWRYGLIGAALCIAGLILLVILTGCDLKERQSTLEQRQRESIAEKTTTSVVQDSVIVPSPTVIETEGKGGEKTRIEVPAVSHTHTATNTTATAASDSAASGASVLSEKFPAWVALIGVGIGLVILTGLLWFWRRSSLAVKAATDKLDAGLAGAIHAVRSEAINAQPGTDTARLVTIAADLERDRVNAIRRA